MHDGFGYYPGLPGDTGLAGSQRCTPGLFPNFTANPIALSTLIF